MSWSTCDIYDQFGEDVRVAPPVFRDFGGRTQFSGAAVTVKCFEDNSRIKELLATPGNGRVLVVDGGASQRCALLGDMIASDAVANGWAGIIVYACVRDSAELAKLDIGIKALGAIPRKSKRRGEGTIERPVDVAGIRVMQGDVVFADGDGIIVMTPEQAEQVSSGQS